MLVKMAKQYFVKAKDLNLLGFDEHVRHEIYKTPTIIYDRILAYIDNWATDSINVGDVFTVVDNHGVWIYDTYPKPYYYTYIYDGMGVYDIKDLMKIFPDISKSHWDNVYKSPKEIEG